MLQEIRFDRGSARSAYKPVFLQTVYYLLCAEVMHERS